MSGYGPSPDTTDPDPTPGERLSEALSELRCFGGCASEHRQGTGRRWCFDCSEWCYADELCVRGEVAALAAERTENERLRENGHKLVDWIIKAEAAYKDANELSEHDLRRADEAEARSARYRVRVAVLERALAQWVAWYRAPVDHYHANNGTRLQTLTDRLLTDPPESGTEGGRS